MLIANSLLISDSVLSNSLTASSAAALTQAALRGDQTADMPVVRDHSNY